MQRLKDENYYVVHAWMINRLGLSGNELTAFAIMYGFCQDGEHEFKGSLNYIAQWMGVKTKNTVIKAINALVDKGVITKEVKIDASGSYTTNAYKINYMTVDEAKNTPLGTPKKGSVENELPSVNNTLPPSVENELPPSVKNTLGSVKTTPNKDIYKDNIYKDNNKDKRERKNSHAKKFSYASSVRLTEEEYSKFVGEYGEEVVKEMINILNDYKESSGKVYKSDAAAIRKWVVRAYYERANKPKGKNDIVSAQQELARRLGENGNNEPTTDSAVWSVWDGE